jgi:hypothetical protein
MSGQIVTLPFLSVPPISLSSSPFGSTFHKWFSIFNFSNEIVHLPCMVTEVT